VRLKAYFVIFVLSPFDFVVVMSSGYNLTITQLSGDSSESSIVISPGFVIRGLINFNLDRLHFGFN